MGNKYRVLAWVPDVGEGYRDDVVYSGQSFFKAFWRMIQAKRGGAGRVSLEWR